jgi:Tfp pilus assembly protein PilN
VGADKPSEMRAVNLLPPDLRSGPKGSAPAVSSGVENSGPGAFVVLGVLAFCVAALATYVLAGNIVKDREAELAAATAKSAAVTQQVNALKPYADFESVANTRVQTVTDLANSRFDWEQALRDLSRAIPADVTIGTLKGALVGDASGGAAAEDAPTGPSLTLAGCTYSQTKVAELMARLRNIDGVTEVLLKKSDKEATAGAGEGDRTAPSASGYCGKADIPAFELTVVFKGAASATAATGATAGTPPTTTSAPAASATPAPAAGAAATPAPAAGAAATPVPATASATPAPTTP